MSPAIPIGRLYHRRLRGSPATADRIRRIRRSLRPDDPGCGYATIESTRGPPSAGATLASALNTAMTTRRRHHQSRPPQPPACPLAERLHGGHAELYHTATTDPSSRRPVSGDHHTVTYATFSGVIAAICSAARSSARSSSYRVCKLSQNCAETPK